MKSFSYIVKEKNGMHARPAGILVKAAEECKSEVVLKHKEKRVSATRLLAIISLGIKKDEEITIEISGRTEEEDMQKMKNIVLASL